MRSFAHFCYKTVICRKKQHFWFQLRTTMAAGTTFRLSWPGPASPAAKHPARQDSRRPRGATSILRPAEQDTDVAQEWAMPKIIVSFDGAVVREVTLAKTRTTLGRRPYNDVVIDNLAVSGEHAVLHMIGGNVYLEDLDS